MCKREREKERKTEREKEKFIYIIIQLRQGLGKVGEVSCLSICPKERRTKRKHTK